MLSVRAAILSLVPLVALTLVGEGARAQCHDPEYLFTFGETGQQPGEFRNPWGIAADAAGNLYVADITNHRIQKFDPDGEFLLEWGGQGTDPGQLDTPTSVAVDTAGLVWVADRHNHRIQWFENDGTFVGELGVPGSAPVEFDEPVGIATSTDGYVYVTDLGNHRVQKFDLSGTFQLEWGSEGSGDGQFEFAGGIAVAPDGTVFVSDKDLQRVQAFDPSGTFLFGFGGPGSGPGQFQLPRDIAFHPSGDIYVVDETQDRVQRFWPDGRYHSHFGETGGDPGEFNKPRGMTAVGERVYVGTVTHDRVQAFLDPDRNGLGLCMFESREVEPGEQHTLVVQLENKDVVEATGVSVGYLVPDDLTLISSITTAGTYDAGLGVWSLPTLAAGTVDTLTLVLEVGTYLPDDPAEHVATIASSDLVDDFPEDDVAQATWARSLFTPVDLGYSAWDIPIDADWGDHDGDGDLDLYLGPNQILRNDGTGQFESVLTLPVYGAGRWGDYDADGDLDLAFTDESYGTHVYRNDGDDTFVDLAVLPGYDHVEWGDYDRDGDLDLLLSGYYGGAIYRNDPSDVFTGAISLPDVRSATWGDHDGDGDLDIVTTGSAGLTIRQNEGGDVFTTIPIESGGMYYGYAVWGDYDADGDLDVAMTAYVGGVARAAVYRNDGGGGFVDVEAGLTGVYVPDLDWGDFDGDGDLDLLVSGTTSSYYDAKLLRNHGADAFEPVDLGYPIEYVGALRWGDADRDGDLDIIATNGATSYLLRNNAGPQLPPSPPVGLTAALTDPATVTLAWNPGADAETPADGLTYNVRVGTMPGGDDLVTAMADPVTGRRSVATRGNADQARSMPLSLGASILSGVPLYWGVQTIDGGLEGSTFAEGTLTLSPVVHSVADVPVDQGGHVRVAWHRGLAESEHSSYEVTGYSIWRLGDPLERDTIPPSASLRRGGTVTWDYVTTVPARGTPTYATIVPTPCDSTGLDACVETYLVSATTPDVQVYLDSEPATGYSLDNLAPVAPARLAYDMSGILDWDDPLDDDFSYHAVYGSDAEELDESASLIGYTTDSTYDVGAAGFGFFHVTASDFAGNEGEAASVEANPLSAPDASGVPAVFALHAVRPNPVRSVATIGFDLPAASAVTLRVYDAMGREVRTLIDAAPRAGRHEVRWDGRDDHGTRLGAGIYFARVVAGTERASRRIVLVR